MDEYGGRVQQEFAENLKALRKAANLTQSQLAEMLCVSRGTISYYEKCERVPDIVFLTKVSSFFGVDTSYMLGETFNLNPKNSDIGLRLNLTDEAIDFFERHDSFGDVLSNLIASHHFASFYNYCYAFLVEEHWREYQNFSACSRYLSNTTEIEDFRAFKICELFLLLLKEEKTRNLFELHYSGMSDQEILNSLRETEEKTEQKMRDYQKMLDEMSTEIEKRCSSAKSMELEEIRKRARVVAGYPVEMEEATDGIDET